MKTFKSFVVTGLVASGLVGGLATSALADKITFVVPNKVWVKQANIGNGVQEMVVHNRIDNKQITLRMDPRPGPTQGVWMPTYSGANTEKPLGNLQNFGRH